ncbi:MAG TPA: hypothetical protein VGD40_18290 [Chryseosolibacter sp.]
MRSLLVTLGPLDIRPSKKAKDVPHKLHIGHTFFTGFQRPEKDLVSIALDLFQQFRIAIPG